MKDQKVKLVKQMLTVLPRQYSDPKLDLVYRHGYLIGMLAEIADRYPDVAKIIDQKSRIHKDV